MYFDMKNYLKSTGNHTPNTLLIRWFIDWDLTGTVLTGTVVIQKNEQSPPKASFDWLRKQFKAPPSSPKKTPLSSSFHFQVTISSLSNKFNLIDFYKNFEFQCSSDAYTIGLPPVWVDDYEEVSVKFQRIRTKMGELVKAHARALMPIEWLKFLLERLRIYWEIPWQVKEKLCMGVYWGIYWLYMILYVYNFKYV